MEAERSARRRRAARARTSTVARTDPRARSRSWPVAAARAAGTARVRAHHRGRAGHRRHEPGGRAALRRPSAIRAPAGRIRKQPGAATSGRLRARAAPRERRGPPAASALLSPIDIVPRDAEDTLLERLRRPSGRCRRPWATAWLGPRAARGRPWVPARASRVARRAVVRPDRRPEHDANAGHRVGRRAQRTPRPARDGGGGRLRARCPFRPDRRNPHALQQHSCRETVPQSAIRHCRSLNSATVGFNGESSSAAEQSFGPGRRRADVAARVRRCAGAR